MTKMIITTSVLLLASAMIGCQRGGGAADNTLADPSQRGNTVAAAEGNQAENVSYGSIISDLTPELSSTVFRPVDGQSHYSVGANQNLRGLRDDFKRSFYLDHPSRLSPYPIIYTSGSPR